ncbi:MAG: phosphopantetheine-binding protein [Bryobacteraceae bacterium]|jgi:acyl carrier protein|nr:phosphopantetheine-binding protein [Bryobacteraceae bacterium]
MDRRSKLIEILRQVAQKDVDPTDDESLFDSGTLDSFALPDLISALEQEFGISIPDSDMNPRKFETVARIGEYLDARQ